MGCCGSSYGSKRGADALGRPIKSEAMPHFREMTDGAEDVTIGSTPEERAAALAEVASLAPALLRSAYGMPKAPSKGESEGAGGAPDLTRVGTKGGGSVDAAEEVANPLAAAGGAASASAAGAGATAAAGAAADPPDFTGEWLCTSATGMEELLKAMGFGWAKCKVAAKMKYGVGRSTLVIMQDGATKMTVMAKGGPRRHTDIVLPGQDFDIDGKPATAVWVNGEIVISISDGSTMTRAINADGILEQRMQKGDVLAIRYHQRIGAAKEAVAAAAAAAAAGGKKGADR